MRPLSGLQRPATRRRRTVAFGRQSCFLRVGQYDTSEGGRARRVALVMARERVARCVAHVTERAPPTGIYERRRAHSRVDCPSASGAANYASAKPSNAVSSVPILLLAKSR